MTMNIPLNALKMESSIVFCVLIANFFKVK